MDKSELIEEIEEQINNLQQIIQTLHESKHTKVKVYSNTDNGGYSNDPSLMDCFPLSVYVDEDKNHLTCIVEVQVD